MIAAAGLSAASPAASLAQQAGGSLAEGVLPPYARARNVKSLKQSSFDKTGGNADSWNIPAGAALDVFKAEGAGVITHIWFTISARSGDHLKELVLRAYWDGTSKPSVETPIGDFFGLNLNFVLPVRIGIPGVLSGQVAELLFRHAVPRGRAYYGDQ